MGDSNSIMEGTPEAHALTAAQYPASHHYHPTYDDAIHHAASVKSTPQTFPYVGISPSISIPVRSEFSFIT